MKTFLAVVIVAGGLAACNRAPSEGYAVDNSGTNVRDRDAAAVTTGDQSNMAADIAITKAIREAVVANKELSTNAHNVKIVTTAGIVSLRGPVGSAAERTTIGAVAQRVTGVKSVDNQLEVTSF